MISSADLPDSKDIDPLPHIENLLLSAESPGLSSLGPEDPKASFIAVPLCLDEVKDKQKTWRLWEGFTTQMRRSEEARSTTGVRGMQGSPRSARRSRGRTLEAEGRS